jgi:hypothetical protein
MCQINSVPLTEPTAIGYRVYYDYDKDSRYFSYYGLYPLPPVGVPTKASDNPFHAFKSFEDLLVWLKHYCLLDSYRIRLAKFYKCKLEENLQEGYWSDTHTEPKVRTITGSVLTVLEDVTGTVLQQLTQEQEVDETTRAYQAESVNAYNQTEPALAQEGGAEAQAHSQQSAVDQRTVADRQ